MTLERANHYLVDFEKALSRLEEALSHSNEGLVVDASIQRFEFTFELAWKLMKEILSHHSLDVRSPRFAIKEAFSLGLIEGGEGWLDMLEDRNKTTHLYDEESAKVIFEKIKSSHFSLLKQLKLKAPAFLEK